MKLDQLGLQIDSHLAHPKAKNFRPPSLPPPADWAPVVDADGNAECLYSDSSWPLDVWAGKSLKLNFGDGKTRGSRIDSANADLLRQCATWFIFGQNASRTAATLKDKFTRIKPLFVTCSAEGIVASDLMRFDMVIDKVAASLAPSHYDHALVVLHELLDAKDSLGFCLLNQDGIKRLAKLAPTHDSRQTAYIPSRIWSYQLSRLRQCLEDYTQHKDQIEACFRFCLDAYAQNYGSLNRAVTSKLDSSRAPFRSGTERRHFGSFRLTSDRFGVTGIIERWVGPFTGQKGEKQIGMFSQYLDLASKAGLAYMQNFSLMRIEEGWNLRSKCLQVEKDEKFGDIHLLCGETTKTDTDADARWPVCSSVSIAKEVMEHIARLRMLCAKERDDIGLTEDDVADPYLMSYQYEPWSKGKHKPYRTRPIAGTYQALLKAYPLLFEVSQITITEDDLRVARLITPTLDSEIFKVGAPWHFMWHQLRRTGAVNMLSSGLVEEPSLQLLLKHLSRVMTLYYGRNHSRLSLNEETRALFLKTMYEEIGRDLRKLASPQFLSPLGSARKDAIVIFIKDADALSLEKAARQGKVGARRIRAGFCVNYRPCPYGGIESIAHCLGGDNGKGCPELLLDATKKPDVERYEQVVDQQLKTVHPDSPRHQSLQVEKQSIKKYYREIKHHVG
jgi:hypothetical protein